MHGNLDVTLIKKKLEVFDKTLTNLRQSPVDENQNYPKHILGAAKGLPGGILLSLGSHQPGFVEVLSKCCRRPPKKTNIRATSRLPCIGHLRLMEDPAVMKRMEDPETLKKVFENIGDVPGMENMNIPGLVG